LPAPLTWCSTGFASFADCGWAATTAAIPVNGQGLGWEMSGMLPARLCGTRAPGPPANQAPISRCGCLRRSGRSTHALSSALIAKTRSAAGSSATDGVNDAQSHRRGLAGDALIRASRHQANACWPEAHPSDP
jgi:hypothetical protein